jgi:hypothetical protein
MRDEPIDAATVTDPNLAIERDRVRAQRVVEYIRHRFPATRREAPEAPTRRPEPEEADIVEVVRG